MTSHATHAVPAATARSTQIAILAMVAASALVAITMLIAKALGQPLQGQGALHPMMVSAGRFAFALVALSVVVALRPDQRPTFAGTRYDLHIARSICGWLGVTAMFAAAARMPLAEATAISFLSPLITMGLAILVLGERATARKGVAAALALAGALALLRPGTEAFHPAALLALLAATLMGIEVTVIKRLSDTEPPMRVLLINNVIGATIAIFAASFVWTTPSALQWALLILLGVIMVSAQASFIQAMKRAPASLVVPVFYITLAFAAIYDFAIFGVRPTGMALAGSALIIAGAWILSRAPAEGSKTP